jgi:hypothetical protein
MKTEDNRILRKHYSTDFWEEEMLGDLKQLIILEVTSPGGPDLDSNKEDSRYQKQ